MEDNVFNKRNLIILLVVILAIIILMRIFSNPTPPPPPPMNPEMENVPETFNNINGEFVPPEIEITPDMENGSETAITVEPSEERDAIPSNYYFIDNGLGDMSLSNNMCSKACCSKQWPVPFSLKPDPAVCQNLNEFVPTNIFCNNALQDAGCMCVTKKQANFLNNRGGNGNSDNWY